MFFLKRLLFKFMELGLGLKTYFCLETKDPVFLNFKLSAEEAAKVQQTLPPGLTLQKVRFAEQDSTAEYWISYNLYHIKYPKPELAHVKRARCEINTFVRDAKGRKGILVFSGSPLVSRETKPGVLGRICEFAERMVIFIYGCGKLVPLVYELGTDALRVEFNEGANRTALHCRLQGAVPEQRLSDEYLDFNDISFFNEGRTFDLVHAGSAFMRARFHRLEGASLAGLEIAGPYFQRSPDQVYFHRGLISYLVDALNRA